MYRLQRLRQLRFELVTRRLCGTAVRHRHNPVQPSRVAQAHVASLDHLATGTDKGAGLGPTRIAHFLA